MTLNFKKIYISLTLIASMLVLPTSLYAKTSHKVNKHKTHNVHAQKKMLLNVNNTKKTSGIISPEPFKPFFDSISYDELIKLSETETPGGELEEKINYFMNTPVIDNSINNLSTYKLKNNEKIGPYIRVGSWNIARGMNVEKIKLIYQNPDLLISTIPQETSFGNVKIIKNDDKKINEDIKNIKSMDILVLNEVDYGMPRTQYKDVARAIALAGGYNYAYAMEFFEIDPVHLGLEDYKWSEERFLLQEGIIKDLNVNKERYKGVHGNAILSKYPLKNVRILRLPKSYDWYKNEKKRATELEKLRRNVAEHVFSEEIIRELRLGSRIALIADIDIPEANTPITIVCAHIENRTPPEQRRKQMQVILNNIKNIKNPIIMAGDFNTNDFDGSPTAVRKELKKKVTDVHFLGRTALLYGNPYGMIIGLTSSVGNIYRKKANPTAYSIPFFAPNNERKLFNLIENFDFEDNSKFDFRGETTKSLNGKKGVLANSNERNTHGYIPTYLFVKDYSIAKFKLDWIFVKPTKDKDSTKFTPHYGHTLTDLNYAFSDPISDHTPIMVDLPITEYKK